MTPTTLAETIADCHATRAVAGAIAGVLLGGTAMAAAGALGAAVLAGLPFALRGWAAQRCLARLETDHPAIFPIAMERYRMVMATQRASRYKLFC